MYGLVCRESEDGHLVDAGRLQSPGSIWFSYIQLNILLNAETETADDQVEFHKMTN